MTPTDPETPQTAAEAEERLRVWIEAQTRGMRFTDRQAESFDALRSDYEAAIRAESTGTLDVASIADRVRAMTPHTGDDYRRGYDRAITLMVAVARLSDTPETGS